MTYVVIHEAIRYGEVQTRTMYRGSSQVWAYVLARVVFLLFAHSLDAVYVCTEVPS